MNTSLISKNAEPLAKSAPNKSTNYVFDELEAFVENYYDESDGKGSAALTYNNGRVILTVVEFRTAHVQVYVLEESVAETINSIISTVLEEFSDGASFWTVWETLMEVFDEYNLVDETMNP